MKNRLIVMLVLLTFLASCAGTSKVKSKHDAVDLGLPSGTLWASCNVGAANPWDYGEYFAWGETTPKAVYDWPSYKYAKDATSSTSKSFTKYCQDAESGYNGYSDKLTVLENIDDAATANWGAEWSTPTMTQWQELHNNCTWTWTTIKNVNGYEVKGKNGKKIFIPAAGSKSGAKSSGVGERGSYWSANIARSLYNASQVGFASNYAHGQGSNERASGQPVRPVQTKK